MRAVIFDCFGVLYVDPSHAFYERHVDNYEPLRPRLMELNTQNDRGLISQRQWHQQVAELTNLPLDMVAQDIEALHARNDDLVAYVSELKSRGVRVGMLSNIGPGGMDRFFSLEQRQRLFDAVVLSGEERIAKPNPAIYRLMAERVEVPISQCLMLDDSRDNCAGADGAGMHAVHYLSNVQAKREIEAWLDHE